VDPESEFFRKLRIRIRQSFLSKEAKAKILHDTEVMRIRYGYPIQNNFFPFSAVEDPDPVGTKNIYRKQTRNSILDPDLNPEYKSGFGEQKRT
jgi:hypothetical protein